MDIALVALIAVAITFVGVLFYMVEKLSESWFSENLVLGIKS